MTRETLQPDVVPGDGGRLPVAVRRNDTSRGYMADPCRRAGVHDASGPRGQRRTRGRRLGAAGGGTIHGTLSGNEAMK